jgi:hypothetical protein
VLLGFMQCLLCTPRVLVYVFFGRGDVVRAVNQQLYVASSSRPDSWAVCLSSSCLR